jgi:hypothetical protein
MKALAGWPERGLWLWALLFAFGLTGSVCLAARDMSSQNILGLRIGMTVDEVNRVLDTLPGIQKRQERTRSSPSGPPGANREPRALYVNFADNRFLSVSFAPRSGASQASEISLVFQGKDLLEQTPEKILQPYGKPDHVRSFGLTKVYSWGGKAEAEGAISPSPGISTTLRAELLEGKQLTLTLTAHGPIAKPGRP